MPHRRLCSCRVAARAAGYGPGSQEKIDVATAPHIRAEDLERAPVDALAQQLLDVIGLGLTGSPTIKQRSCNHDLRH